MKNISLFALALLSSNSWLVAMDLQEQKKENLVQEAKLNELTAEENNCFKWFRAQHDKLPSHPLQKLTEEDQGVFNKNLLYAKNPIEVTRSRHNYVEAFWTLAEEARINRDDYDKDTLKRAVLKTAINMHTKKTKEPTDEIEAREYAFVNELNSSEKSTWMKDNYLADPQAAESSILKWSDAVAKKLAELKLIEDTQEGKKGKSQELFTKKLAELKKACIKSK